MKYTDFKSKMRRFPIITGTLLSHLDEDERILRNQLSRWQNQELLIKLRKGLYLLNRDDRSIQPSKFFLANQIVFPSYVSLESALAYYRLIPEVVYRVTNVTTAKPVQYRTQEGAFSFRHLKSNLFFGFKKECDEAGFDFLIAEPEKAFLDFLYLNLAKFLPADTEIFEESYRFANFEMLQADRLRSYAVRFGSKKLLRVVKLFIDAYLSARTDA